jgi:RNA polymerase sigma factor (sigma-70 family)
MMGSVEHEVGAWPPALERLYRDEHAQLLRTARMMVGSLAVAEELTQDAFVRLQGAWERVDNPPAFVRTVLVNLCRTWLQRAERERRRPVVDEGLSLPPELDETWRAVQRLPERYRTVLALRFYADLPETEIAELMGCRPGTVRSLLHRGLDKLRKELT